MTSLRHNPAPAPTREASPDDAYLDAAREAILAVGWSRTTLTDIARRAGVSRMTLYRRWPDTQTLLADLMTREWGHVVEAAGVEQAATGERRRRPRADRPAASSRPSRHCAPTRCCAGSSTSTPRCCCPTCSTAAAAARRWSPGRWPALIAQGQRDGTIRAGDPAVLARSLVLACHGFTLSAHTMTDARGSRDADVSHLDVELGELVRRYLQA